MEKINQRNLIKNLSLIINKKNFEYNAFEEIYQAYRVYKIAVHNTKISKFIKEIDEQFQNYLDSTKLQDKIISKVRNELLK